MQTTPKAGVPVDSDEVEPIGGGAGEGTCVDLPNPEEQPTGDGPWWRVLQDAWGNLVK